MRLVNNTGTDRVIDLVRPSLTCGNQLDVVTPTFSLYAYAEIIREVSDLALLAARITGSFVLPDPAGRVAALRDSLDAYSRMRHDIALLRARAAKEKQISRRVEMNLKIKRLEAEIASVSRSLGGE